MKKKTAIISISMLAMVIGGISIGCEKEVDQTDQIASKQKCTGNLEDIGTSEHELQELLIKGYKAAAKNWLKHAREATGNNTHYINYVREYIELAGCSLKEVGTSKKEVLALLK